ncbi:hypothetical protein PHISCL_07155 [Aspergillus sclerotialis]|uniref:F-box domain protein n=1 Tax=Aspergillus sclerotialis TaxID=2070753 RepID=A0A3A2ZMC8_9EURO|nr:hypothetical protein PHISCL_07155 [Aspergillus sclerotialis]
MASEDLNRIRIRSAKDVDKQFGTLLSALREPALGEQIRHLEMDRSLSGLRDDLPRVEIPRELEDRDKDLLDVAVRRAGFEGPLYDLMMNLIAHTPGTKEYDFCRGFNYNPEIFLSQALAALIISVSPNLESIAFPEFSGTWAPPSESGLVLQAFIEHANANPTQIPYLQNLRTVRCLSNKAVALSDERFYERYDLLQNMKLVGNLPAIESLIVNAIDDEWVETKLAPSSTNFKKVAIHHSIYSSSNLARIIRSCRRLEEFEFSIGGRAALGGSSASFDKVDLLNALSFHTQTLRVLDINIDEDLWDSPMLDEIDDYEEEDDQEEDDEEDSANWKKVFSEDYQVLSLKELPALTRLSIGIKLLAAIARGRAREGQPIETPITVAEILPPNLEYLRIRGYNPGTDPEYDAQAASLIERSRTHLLPRIDGLDMCIPNGKSVEDPDNHPELLWADEDWDFGRWK